MKLGLIVLSLSLFACGAPFERASNEQPIGSGDGSGGDGGIAGHDAPATGNDAGGDSNIGVGNLNDSGSGNGDGASDSAAPEDSGVSPGGDSGSGNVMCCFTCPSSGGALVSESCNAPGVTCFDLNSCAMFEDAGPSSGVSGSVMKCSSHGTC
jgi:hypothetical protein